MAATVARGWGRRPTAIQFTQSAAVTDPAADTTISATAGSVASRRNFVTEEQLRIGATASRPKGRRCSRQASSWQSDVGRGTSVRRGRGHGGLISERHGRHDHAARLRVIALAYQHRILPRPLLVDQAGSEEALSARLGPGGSRVRRSGGVVRRAQRRVDASGVRVITLGRGALHAWLHAAGGPVRHCWRNLTLVTQRLRLPGGSGDSTGDPLRPVRIASPGYHPTEPAADRDRRYRGAHGCRESFRAHVSPSTSTL